jgi:hypothetical protein
MNKHFLGDTAVLTGLSLRHITRQSLIHNTEPTRPSLIEYAD